MLSSENIIIQTCELIHDIVNTNEMTLYYSNEYDDLISEYKKLSLKQLIFIYNYYYNKTGSFNKKKDILIREIIEFEKNNQNYDIVNKRKTLLFYYDLLKNDVHYKKYILDI
jgi:hypothetical protein